MASFILGLASLVCVCVSAVPGVICGIIGLSNVSKSNGRLKGRGLAILGIVLSLLLTVVGAAGWMAAMSKQFATSPLWQEVFGAGKGLFLGKTKGQEIATALRSYTHSHDGRLPASLDELVAAGTLDAAALAHPVDGTPGFWELLAPGVVLADLPRHTVIARSGPVHLQDQAWEFVIHANLTVHQVEVPGLDMSAGLEIEAEDIDIDADADIDIDIDADAPADEGILIPEPAEVPER